MKYGEKIDHIHGKACKDVSEDSNIILGITSEDEKLQGYYVEFEKYFQRIIKKTGNEYKKWLSARVSKNSEIQVAIFGHSLDPADSDILMDLICHENSVIRIFYHTEKALQQIVGNLIEMIGKQKVIQFTSGRKPKIKFEKQELHRHDETAGLKITRNIHTLYQLYKHSQNKIEALVKNINKKIDEKDTAYFAAQKNVISMFEALQSQGIEHAPVSDFCDIASKLEYETTSDGSLVTYSKEEWYGNTPWEDVIPCSKETEILIDCINDINRKEYFKRQAQKPHANILAMQTSDEMKAALRSIFERDPVAGYWRELEGLINLMLENENFETAVNELVKEDVPLKVLCKARHFHAVYEEIKYNYEMMKEVKKSQGI